MRRDLCVCSTAVDRDCPECAWRSRRRVTLPIMGTPDFAPPTPDELTRAIAAGISSGAAAPVDEELWERRMKALTLRNAGATFSQIGQSLTISPTVARADVRLALREVLSESTEDFIARQRSVLLDCQRGAYPEAMKGDKDSIMAIVRCLEQEAKLLGLYAPMRQVVGISDVDFSNEAAELISKLGLQPPKELMAHAPDTQRRAFMAGLGQPAAAAGAVDVGEIVDGVVERCVGLGFDLPAYDLPVDAEPLDAQISDDAISRAAAAAIDPDTYGDDDSGGHGAQPGGWSNL
jgi:hypothetical protein